MTTGVPCARCGSFLDSEATAAGFSACEECIQRLVDPPKPRSLANSFALIGGVAGLLVAVVAGLLVSPLVFAYVHLIAGAGAIVGVLAGMPSDVVRARRERAERGFDGVAWVAVLDWTGRTPSSVRTGFVLLGDGRLLFASKHGDRIVIQPQDVTTIRGIEEKKVELDLVKDGKPARLVLVGEGAKAAAERMMEG